jgi:hypothetical protein
MRYELRLLNGAALLLFLILATCQQQAIAAGSGSLAGKPCGSDGAMLRDGVHEIAA